MIALVGAAIAALVFGMVTGHWEAAVGIGIAYAFGGLVWLEMRWRMS